MNTASPRGVMAIVSIFAAGYLLSSLLRGVTAALAPVFVAEFGASPAQLGLLAGAYFASFALLQLPMGAWLDRHGVRLVLMVSLTVAAASCVLFAAAGSLPGLVGARLLAGVGVSACLIAPLTAARLWTGPGEQQRINAWMLMAGALGLVLGTLPAESVASTVGWRPLFVAVGAMFAGVAVLIALLCPAPEKAAPTGTAAATSGYAAILRNPCMLSLGPLALFNYAILVAVQTLWAGPWLTTLGGMGARDAATQLMLINGIVLGVFLVMGWLSPRINASAEDGERILRVGAPLGVAMLFLIAWMGEGAGWAVFAVYCVLSWPLSVTHPLVGQRFAPGEAGRAIALFNLLLFAGVFAWQWGFGIVVMRLEPVLGAVDAYRLGMLLLALLSLAGYGVFLATVRRGRAPAPGQGAPLDVTL